MRKHDDLLRALVRETILETLSKADLALANGLSPEFVKSRQVVDPSGMGRMVRVELNGKTWLTSNAGEVERVLNMGGKVLERDGKPVRESV